MCLIELSNPAENWLESVYTTKAFLVVFKAYITIHLPHIHNDTTHTYIMFKFLNKMIVQADLNTYFMGKKYLLACSGI